ncbi:MAG TPA: carboxypeptidase-like regulatory domain-containing protein, partial [Chitinophagaceae bacterium]
MGKFYAARTKILGSPDGLPGFISPGLRRTVMLTVLVLLLSCMQAYANGKDQIISISLKKATLERVFEEIKKQAGYSFVYNSSLLKKSKRVDIEAVAESVEEVMKKCMKDQPFTYTIIDQTIVVKPLDAKAPKEEPVVNAPLFQTIRGRVTTSVGTPLSGVTVQVKGEDRATSTSDNGEFTLQATAPRPTLIFSMVGYKSREVEAPEGQFLTVVLVEDIKKMDDVVVTGVYNRKASSFTGATLNIKKEELKKVGNANVFQALKNISPSLVLDNFELGSNPNALPDIRIRGTSSLPVEQTSIAGSLKGNYLKNPNEPLFILDGFETTAERVFDLDMNRIESITILKDASSKALYGSKAANGVIVIETVKLTSAKPLVSYNSSVDVDLPDLRSYNLTNSAEKLEAERIDGMYTANPSGYDAPAQHAELQQLYNYRKKLVQEGLNTYWLAKPLRDGIGHKHSLMVELGGDNLRIAGNLTYRNVAGVMKGSSRQNIGGDMSTSYRLKNFLFRNITSVNSNKSSESPYGLFSEYVRMNPYWRAENEDGTIPYYAELGPNGARYVNPLYNSTINTKNTASYFNVVNNFYLEWTMRPGLKAVTRVGIDVNQNAADE